MSAANHLTDRVPQPEMLDQLPASDPNARRSRRDLRRVNTWMGNARTVTRCLRSAGADSSPIRLVELGAGDGTFLLAVARRLPGGWSNVEATLVDLQNLLSPDSATAFRARGWSVNAVATDVFEWLQSREAGTVDVLLANLFLHHFSNEQLKRLFQLASERARWIVACEPRRSRLALTGVRLLPLIGCNHVTRHDARVSVRAGFQGQELSALWPDPKNWNLREGSPNPVAHVFEAKLRVHGT